MSEYTTVEFDDMSEFHKLDEGGDVVVYLDMFEKSPHSVILKPYYGSISELRETLLTFMSLYSGKYRNIFVSVPSKLVLEALLYAELGFHIDEGLWSPDRNTSNSNDTLYFVKIVK